MNFDRVTVVNSLATQKAIYAADDGDVAMVVRYIGSQASGTVEIDADGNLLFKHGVLDSEEADTTVSTDGTIDVSGASENTFVEVLEAIHASANWEAKLVGALTTDSSNNKLLLAAAAQAKSDAGLKLYFDTSDTLFISLNISAMGWEVQKGADGNPWSPDEDDYINSLFEWNQLNTYGSGTSIMTVYEVDRASGRETTLITRAGAATTVVGNKDWTSGGNGWGICAAKGCELIVRMTGSAACTGSLEVSGASRKFGY